MKWSFFRLISDDLLLTVTVFPGGISKLFVFALML
jgi:hypothetical protein